MFKILALQNNIMPSNHKKESSYSLKTSPIVAHFSGTNSRQLYIYIYQHKINDSKPPENYEMKN